MPTLDPEVVQKIVVSNAPIHPPDPAPNTRLKQLGIVGSQTARIHRAGIQSDLRNLGWRITQNDIESSPTKTIAACRDSVLANAT